MIANSEINDKYNQFFEQSEIPSSNNPNKNFFLLGFRLFSLLKNTKPGDQIISILIKLILKRNSQCAFPAEIREIVSTSPVATSLLERAAIVYLRSGIQKYPQYFFECNDLDALYKTYFLQKSSIPVYERGSRFFSYGSCFAQYISATLSQMGCLAYTPFNLNENANSSTFLLSTLRQATGLEAPNEQALREKPRIINLLSRIGDQVRSADVIILTIGLAFDWFHADGTIIRSSFEPREVFKTATMKLMDISRNTLNLESIVSTIRLVNEHASIVFTLSPIPIDGVRNCRFSVIEADCISKSISRASLAMLQDKELNSVYYYPSFELVRWCLCNRDLPLYGGDVDDGNLRHITESLQREVIQVFCNNHLKSPEQG